MTNRLLLATPIIIALAGCHSDHPTPPTSSRQSQANALVAEVLKIDTPSAQAAFVLSAADRNSAPTVATINAIRSARALVLEDLRHADTIGYKSSLASIPSAGPPILQRDMTQGACQSTGRSLDLAIAGSGFFKIKIPNSDSVAYTRNGNFFINNHHQLTLGIGDAYQLLPPITFPPGATDPSISQDGIIECTLPAPNTKIRLGQLQLSHFLNPQFLTHLGGSLYTPSNTSGPPIDSPPGSPAVGTLLQGFLESSNTDLIRARLRLRFLQEWETTLLTSLAHP